MEVVLDYISHTHLIMRYLPHVMGLVFISTGCCKQENYRFDRPHTITAITTHTRASIDMQKHKHATFVRYVCLKEEVDLQMTYGNWSVNSSQLSHATRCVFKSSTIRR